MTASVTSPPTVRRALTVILGVLALVTAGCGGPPDNGARSADKPSVVVSFFPIADAVSKIGGDAIDVVNLTPPGVGPHDLELTPQERQSLESADAVVYLGSGFQPQVEEVVKGLPASVKTVDLLGVEKLLPVTPPLAGVQGEVDGEELAGGKDPHAWVSPRNFATMVKAMTQTLDELLPEDRARIDAASAAYTQQLTNLDQEFSAQLKNCQSRAIVTSHRAFEYLARDYGLTQIPIAGLSPEEEPDPRTLQAVAAAARADNVTTVYFEDTVPPALADTVAREIGARTDLLSPLETIDQQQLDAGASYVGIQQDNLGRLVKGLRCGG